jgi:endoglucanase
MKPSSLYNGINLGGWLSQYKEFDHEHFRTFITAPDLRQISDWGLDHVRLPFDYPILEDDDQPGQYKESGFDYIEACLEWCQANDLRLILDLHKAPGYSFDTLDENSMFGNPALQERYLALWEAIVKRFLSRYPNLLVYELLNEIVLPTSEPWNELARKVMGRIRAIDHDRLIIAGGNFYNSADELANLDLPADSNLLYTFHYYKPIAVTHQLAPWVPPMVQYGQPVEYPGQALGLERVRGEHVQAAMLENEFGAYFDKEFLRTCLKPALDFMAETRQPLYCGEFGVYERASLPTRLNWTRDFMDLLDEYKIGRAYWTYKALDFGLIDSNGKIVSQELIDIVSRK